MTNNPTIRDVARQAGVSVATVSRTLNNQPGIAAETRQRVTRVASDIGYDLRNLRPTRLRRPIFLFRRQRGGLGGNPFYSHVLHGVEEACQRQKLGLSYSSVGAGDVLGEIVSRQEADGLVCVGYFPPEQLQEALRLGLPAVLIDHWFPGMCCVNSDNFGGAYQLTEHLIRQGRKRIAFISGPPTHYSISQRQQGYRHALLTHHLPPDPQLEVARFPLELEEGAGGAVRTLMALPAPPDAIFAYNDATALQVLRACRQLGIQVPGDLAVVGFDDLAASGHALPPLTTIRVDKEGLGARGIEALLNSSSSEALLTLPVSLIVRESSHAEPPEGERAVGGAG